ncbi:MAG: GNAT family N-acetyltransferase [Alphaproteobacteria bacterium]|nr:GNAT family N-acetyltransferase [Alphaproteobacteria bacterium]
MPIVTDQPDFSSATLGSLTVRLARTKAEIDAALDLRYRVFYRELSATPDPGKGTAHDRDAHDRDAHDRDAYDEVAEHLLVFDADTIIATSRLITNRDDHETRFYTESEFDVSALRALYPSSLLEVGRTCVESKKRQSSAMQVMWSGLAVYCFAYNIDALFGCGSFHGADMAAHRQTLGWLHHHHLAPAAWRPRALPDHFASIDCSADPAFDPQATPKLPALIKGYLRIGGCIGDGAFIDHAFDTTDVCIVVKREAVAARYFNHYQRAHDVQSR